MTAQLRRIQSPIQGVACLLLLFTLLPNWMLSAVSEQEASVVSLDPPTTVLEIGESTRIAVRIEGAANVYGAEIHLSFDASKIQILDADASAPGVQLASGDFLSSSQGFLVANEADNEAGTLVYALTLLAPSEPASGAGTLVEFDLTTIAQGEITLVLDPVILASPDGVALPVLVENGQLSISANEVMPVPTESLPIATAPPAVTTAEPVATATYKPASETVTVTAATAAHQPTPDSQTPVGATGDLTQSPPDMSDGAVAAADTPVPLDSGIVPTVAGAQTEDVLSEASAAEASQGEAAPPNLDSQAAPAETNAVSATEPQATIDTTRQVVVIIGQNVGEPEQLVTDDFSESSADPTIQIATIVLLLGIGLIILVLATWILLNRIPTFKSGEDNDVY